LHFASIYLHPFTNKVPSLPPLPPPFQARTTVNLARVSVADNSAMQVVRARYDEH
jgi:hypothetical protein